MHVHEQILRASVCSPAPILQAVALFTDRNRIHPDVPCCGYAPCHPTLPRITTQPADEWHIASPKACRLGILTRRVPESRSPWRRASRFALLILPFPSALISPFPAMHPRTTCMRAPMPARARARLRSPPRVRCFDDPCYLHVHCTPEWGLVTQAKRLAARR